MKEISSVIELLPYIPCIFASTKFSHHRLNEPATSVMYMSFISFYHCIDWFCHSFVAKEVGMSLILWYVSWNGEKMHWQIYNTYQDDLCLCICNSMCFLKITHRFAIHIWYIPYVSKNLIWVFWWCSYKSLWILLICSGCINLIFILDATENIYWHISHVKVKKGFSRCSSGPLHCSQKSSLCWPDLHKYVTLLYSVMFLGYTECNIQLPESNISLTSWLCRVLYIYPYTVRVKTNYETNNRVQMYPKDSSQITITWAKFLGVLGQ